MATSDDNPPRDGFLVYRSPQDKALRALRVSDVKELVEADNGATLIYAHGGCVPADESVDILARRLNNLLGTTDVEGVRRYSPDMAPAHRPNFAGEILR